LGHRQAEIEGLGASVAAIAVMATFSQMAFAKKLGVESLSCPTGVGRKADALGVRYDVWKGHEGVAKRSLFVIDRRGIIRYRWVTETP
jgi:glutaredoxin-dependent peroxiredoxin